MSNYHVLGSIVGHHHHGGGNWGAGGGWWPWGPGAPDMYWSRPYYVGPIDEIDDTVVVTGESGVLSNLLSALSPAGPAVAKAYSTPAAPVTATPAADTGTSHKDTVAERPSTAWGSGGAGDQGPVWTPEQRTAAVEATKAANAAAKPEPTLTEKAKAAVAAMPTWKKVLLGGLAAVAVVAVGGGVVTAVRR